MKIKYVSYNGLLTLIVLLMVACKKDKNTVSAVGTPVVEGINRPFVQAGDELTIYGRQMVQQNAVTEVFLSGRPARILRQATDSISVLVPSKAISGKVMITLSLGSEVVSAYGPAIEIKPSPLVKGFSPGFGYEGDVIELYTENFAADDQDNSIFLGNKQLQIILRKGSDTFLVKIPDGSLTGHFSWNTYNGPVDTLDMVFSIRQSNYAVNTSAEWLHADPAFSFMDTLIQGYPVLAGSNYEAVHKRIYDSVMQFIGGSERTYTIFLPYDGAYLKNNITKEAFVEKIVSTPYNYNAMLAAAIVPGQNIRLAEVVSGDTYNTAYTMSLAFYPYPVEADQSNDVTITETDGQQYAQIFGPYQESRPAVRILREHQIGNATILETDGELGMVNF